MKQIVAGMATIALSAGIAQAQQACAPTDAIANILSEQHGESIRAQGFTSGTVLQMWANEETGTWTVITVHPDGASCVRASGGNFVTFDPSPAGTDG